VGESAPGAGIVNVSGSYQVAGSQISAANLSDGTTGTGAIVKANAPAFTGNPTGITALGVNESTPGTGIINVSGSYQVGGSQIAVGNLASVNNNTIVGNNSGGSAAPSALTAANVLALLGFSSAGWTPTDQSGAGLTFTSVNAQYCQIGNIVFAYGTLTYPSTADTHDAIISLPVAVPNQSYAVITSVLAAGSNNAKIHTVQNSSTAAITGPAGAALTNAGISAVTLNFMLIYPAS
jgi:hypothetical protein